MVNGVVLATTRGAVALVRCSTLFLLTLVENGAPPALQCVKELLQELPQDESADGPADAGEEDATAPAPVPQAQTEASAGHQHTAKQGITAAAFFQPDAARAGVYALLLLVDERRLVHYEADVDAQTVELRAVRTMPRNSTCMIVSSVTVDGETKHIVLVGEKTGEVVAMPFPDIARDLKTLLGHTTSMITHMAATADRSLLLTADRDEKIRVSHFPRTPLVQSYCLGHKASLTRVVCSVATPQLAVSTALDNTLKLWDVATGALLASQPLLDSESDDDVDALKTALVNVSLAICPVRNLIAVAVNHTVLRFFAIEATTEVDAPPFQLVRKALSSEIETYVRAHEPSEVAFAGNGVLTLAYRKSPFLRLFDVSNVTATNVVLVEHSAHEALTQLRTDAAKIDLPQEGDETADELEGGLQKKKVKLNAWTAMAAKEKAS